MFHPHFQLNTCSPAIIFCPPGDRAVRPLLRMINFLGDAPILTRAELGMRRRGQGIHHGVCIERLLVSLYHCTSIHPASHPQVNFTLDHCTYRHPLHLIVCVYVHQGKTCERAAIRTRGSIPTIDSELKYGGV